MKNITRRWMVLATAAVALVGCSSSDTVTQGVAPADTLEPVDKWAARAAMSQATTASSQSAAPAATAVVPLTASLETTAPPPQIAAPEEVVGSEELWSVPSGEWSEEEKAILDKYDLDHEDVGGALSEFMAAAFDGSTQTAEESGQRLTVILDAYDIDSEDFGKAWAEMIADGAQQMRDAYPPCPAEGETLPADFKDGCMSADTILVAVEADGCFIIGDDFYADFTDRIFKRSTGADDPAASDCFWAEP